MLFFLQKEHLLCEVIKIVCVGEGGVIGIVLQRVIAPRWSPTR